MKQNKVIKIENLDKFYKNGTKALSNINLDVKKGEIFALLGPNGAGKTSLINSVCGIVKFSSGNIRVFGFDVLKEYRKSRSLIGLVPQELTTDSFETVLNTVKFSRGLFGKKNSDFKIEIILKNLSLWDKRKSQIRTLSGGMKRRVMIAKALSHEPEILFLDEPSAGVDVELRKTMWNQIRNLKKSGVTIILTTHYIEEAEEMADRIGILNKGKLIMVEAKRKIMENLGEKKFEISLKKKIKFLPKVFNEFDLEVVQDYSKIIYYNNPKSSRSVAELLDKLKKHSIEFNDITTKKNSLEEIFINIVGKK
tara:strand:+ start:143 stop:1069 length:927 start_codon:yes stop_codon:yes gene_type:complete